MSTPGAGQAQTGADERAALFARSLCLRPRSRVLFLVGEPGDEVGRYGLVVVVLRSEAAAPTGERPQVDRVSHDLRRRHERGDRLLAVADGLRSLHAPAARV